MPETLSTGTIAERPPEVKLPLAGAGNGNGRHGGGPTSAGPAGWQRVVAIIGISLLALAMLALVGRYGRPARSDHQPTPPRLEDLSQLAGLPVLENGRVKPLDSYARNTLLRFSGRTSYQGLSGLQWLARVVFTPNEAYDDQVFLVDNPEVLDAIGVDSTRGRGRYSLNQLTGGIGSLADLAAEASGIEADRRTLVERELIRLFNALVDLSSLMQSMAFTGPREDAFQIDDAELAQQLGLPGPGPYSYLDLAARRGQLEQLADAAASRHGVTGAISAGDMAAIQLADNLAFWQESFSGLPMDLVPVAGPRIEATWVSPWELLAQSQLDPAMEAELSALRDMHLAYVNGQQVQFNLAARRFSQSTTQRTQAYMELPRLGLEEFYNRLDAFRLVKLFYLLGLLALVASMIVARKPLYWASLTLLIVGLLPHTAGIIMRMIISGRPPVTSLFETFLFVGWVGALLGLAAELLGRRRIGLSVGLSAGLLMTVISGKFSAEGDTIQVLQAVLDTNFWLSTHVVAITIGYAGCIVAGLVAHVYMAQALLWPDDRERLSGTYKAMFAILAFGLTFSFIGTMLGGVWADQSWGRFWGWDPKENGALMIVLWSAMLFHARLGKVIGDYGMAVGSALGIVVVMFAWFGINELGVGLHSYGFTEGVLGGLFTYVALEAIFIGCVTVLVKLRERDRREPVEQ